MLGNALLLGHIDLEADDVAVLDLALEEGGLHLHELDHVGLDLLVDLERGRGRVAHALVDHHREVEDAHVAVDVEMADAGKRLVRDVKVLDEDHYRRLGAVRLLPLGLGDGVDVLEIELEVVLP